jgi:hypothetical protein
MKRILKATAIFGLSALALLSQDVVSKFNGTWKGDGGQVRKLTVKDGVIYMQETQVNGSVILRNYPFQGQEITMTEGVWKDAKATGKMEGNKLVVETTQGNGTMWHDEWTMADDGKTYSALRQRVGGGPAGGRGAGGGAGAGAGAAAGGGAGRGAGGGGGRGSAPETFTKIE